MTKPIAEKMVSKNGLVYNSDLWQSKAKLTKEGLTFGKPLVCYGSRQNKQSRSGKTKTQHKRRKKWEKI